MIQQLQDRSGVRRYKSVHRLVGLAHIPNPNNYPIINHIDGNKTNNSLENLEWTTHSKNTLHAIHVLDTNMCKGKRITLLDKNYKKLQSFENFKQLGVFIGYKESSASSSITHYLEKLEKDSDKLLKGKYRVSFND